MMIVAPGGLDNPPQAGSLAGSLPHTFDGFPPEPRHRALGFAGSCLSFCTVVGSLWALADEESLTWQDYISRTFPTPLASDSQIFHRR